MHVAQCCEANIRNTSRGRGASSGRLGVTGLCWLRVRRTRRVQPQCVHARALCNPTILSSLSKQAASSDKRSHACDNSDASAAPLPSAASAPVPLPATFCTMKQTLAHRIAERAFKRSIAPAAHLGNQHRPSLGGRGTAQAGSTENTGNSQPTNPETGQREAAEPASVTVSLGPVQRPALYYAGRRRQLMARGIKLLHSQGAFASFQCWVLHLHNSILRIGSSFSTCIIAQQGSFLPLSMQTVATFCLGRYAGSGFTSQCAWIALVENSRRQKTGNPVLDCPEFVVDIWLRLPSAVHHRPSELPQHQASGQ
ncbi:hypothetical protein TgHK011_005218 [Trichoderma gracile]|nr:hypothetical protein TgHK011_005218 [Trichoderma gracile]